ncbi:MAG: group 1 truncated hemoglobin [Rhodospirillaceae bacterium]|jgi:hemoglobin|nr:group 1 truncated hemoglobin [Rhodospirillaceae bacterium]MBT5459411.1 group 1 truncated hemoglobin [Rhodospirillaceae bacterium]
MTQSMFHRYGGFASVSKVVSAFYDKALDSPLLAPYFENVEMSKQIEHQTKFIASLMGGPASYSNEELERVHSRLNINEAEFQEMVALLKETLEDFDFDDTDIGAVQSEMMSRKRFIVVREVA